MTLPGRKSRKGDAMDDFLFSLGLIRKPIPKDHTSLFRVISDQVYMTQRYHEEIKAACFDYLIRTHHHLADLFSQPTGNLDFHVHSRENADVYYAILNGLSLLYNRDFVAYREINMPPELLTSGCCSEKIMLVESFGHHFDSVYPRTYNYKAAICQSIVYNVLYRYVLGMNDEVDLALGMLRTRSTERRRVLSLTNNGYLPAMGTSQAPSSFASSGGLTRQSAASSGVFTRLTSSGYEPSLRGSNSDFESSAEHGGTSITYPIHTMNGQEQINMGAGVVGSYGYYGSFQAGGCVGEMISLSPNLPCADSVAGGVNPLGGRSMSLTMMSSNSPQLQQSAMSLPFSMSPNQWQMGTTATIGQNCWDPSRSPLSPQKNHSVPSEPPSNESDSANRPVQPFSGPPFPFRVAKSLDPVIYRNVEYDVWLESRRQHYFTTLALSAKCKFHPGAACLVALPTTSVPSKDSVDEPPADIISNIVHQTVPEPNNAGSYRQYHGIVQEIDYVNGGPVVVFIHELGEKRSVPMASLTECPIPTCTPSGDQNTMMDDNCPFGKDLHELGDLDEFPTDFHPLHEESCFSPEDYLSGLAWFGAGVSSPPYYASPQASGPVPRVDGNDVSSNSYSSSPECQQKLPLGKTRKLELPKRCCAPPARSSRSSDGLFQFDQGSGDFAEDNSVGGAHRRSSGSLPRYQSSRPCLNRDRPLNAGSSTKTVPTDGVFPRDIPPDSHVVGKIVDGVSRMAIRAENCSDYRSQIAEESTKRGLNDSDWPMLPLELGHSSNGSSGSPPHVLATPRQVPSAPRKIYLNHRNRKPYRSNAKNDNGWSTESSSHNGHHTEDVNCRVRKRLDFREPTPAAASPQTSRNAGSYSSANLQTLKVHPRTNFVNASQTGDAPASHHHSAKHVFVPFTNLSKYTPPHLRSWGNQYSGSFGYSGRSPSSPAHYHPGTYSPDTASGVSSAPTGYIDANMPACSSTGIQPPSDGVPPFTSTAMLSVDTVLAEAGTTSHPPPVAVSAPVISAGSPHCSEGLPAGSPSCPSIQPPQTLIMPFFPVIQASYFDQSYVNAGRINLGLSASQDVNGIDLPFNGMNVDVRFLVWRYCEVNWEHGLSKCIKLLPNCYS